MFKRNFNDELIEKLVNSDLYREKILGDIKSGNVFPGIRSERIDFYHNGGKLFTYDGEFKTHVKFASVYRLDDEKNYVTERDLLSSKICNFLHDYERIKENCSKFSGEEALGVSRIYGKYSYVTMMSGVMVLDIEVSFRSDEEDRSQDRIDLLLLNNGVLRFYEAKHFSNGEIWAKLGSKPKVAGQVVRYKNQIKKNAPKIIEQYRNYVAIINEIFDLNVGLPQKVDYDVPVLVFGFDRDQLRGRFKTLFEGNLKNVIRYYSIGNIKQIKIKNMWDACK